MRPTAWAENSRNNSHSMKTETTDEPVPVEVPDRFVFDPNSPPVRRLLVAGIPEERLREIAEVDAEDIDS